MMADFAAQILFAFAVLCAMAGTCGIAYVAGCGAGILLAEMAVVVAAEWAWRFYLKRCGSI